MSVQTAAEVIQALVEAVVELSDGPRHPALDAGLDWLALRAGGDDRLPRRIKPKNCRDCGEEFFFANRAAAGLGGKVTWVPICPIPIRSGDVILDACTLDFTLQVPIILPTEPGLQWIPHRLLCGMTSPPLDPDLAEIWHQTVGQLERDEEEAIASMLTLVRDIEAD